jgi:LuxR family maltose regulon positive regulatory protein
MTTRSAILLPLGLCSSATLDSPSTEPLSRQEVQVLHLLVAGQTYMVMAKVLVGSPNTIKSQVGSIYRKMGVRSCLEAYTTAQCLYLL